jgi:DNA-binding transcriptional regulator YiaG
VDGNELDSIRRTMGLSYEKLGALLGVHRGTIFRWCRQGDPIPHLSSIALDSLLKTKGGG